MAKKRMIPIQVEIAIFNRDCWSRRWTTDLRCPRCGAWLIAMPLDKRSSEHVYSCPDCSWWLYGHQMDWDYFDAQRTRQQPSGQQDNAENGR